MRLQRENMDIDAKNQQQIARVKAEEDRNNEAFKTDQEIRKETAKADLELRNKKEEHMMKMEEITLEKSLDAQNNADQLKTKTA